MPAGAAALAGADPPPRFVLVIRMLMKTSRGETGGNSFDHGAAPTARRRAAAATAASVLGLAGAFLAGCLVRGGGPGEAVGANMVPAAELRPLRQAAEAAHRQVGTCLMSDQLDDPEVTKLLASDFSSLTPENEMKWEAIEPRTGGFAYGPGDRIVAFAASKGMRVRGHTLVWHSQLPGWVRNLSVDGRRATMARHIQRVVGHWKGRVAQWDVVNEAFADGPSGQLRPESPWTALGPMFISEAFDLAHQADPDAKLFYNDYEIEEEGTPKSEAVYRMCKRMKEAGVPIHGIGLQTHVDPRHGPNIEKIRSNIARFAALGLLVELTEVDVPVGAIPGTLEEKLNRQRAITHDLVAACVAVEGCTGVTFWGLSDRTSWLNDPQWAQLRGDRPHYPLPFNRDYQPKPMVLGILDAFSGK